MTVKTIPLTAISVQSAKPNTRFGQPSILPVSSANQICARASLTGIPAGATVTSATLSLRSRNNPTWAGARTVKARRATSPSSTSTTWNTKPPSSVTGEATATLTDAPFGSTWTLDVTSLVQGWVSGTNTNYGFLIFTSDTSVGQLQGATAPWGAPYLTVTYVTTAVAPTALHPSSGAVSLAKPTLSFQTPSDIISIEVQVDPAANGTTPAYDSGEVAATAGLLDLSQAGAMLGTNPTLEVDASGWATVTNCTIARSTTQKRTGVASLAVTASAAGDTRARTSGVTTPIVAGQTYKANAWVRAATTARVAVPELLFLDSGGAQVGSTVTNAGVSDSTSAWTALPEVSGVAPATAVSATLRVKFTGCASGEVHYIDDAGPTDSAYYAGLDDGSSTQWRARVKNGLGWSSWSSWVTFSRAAFKTLTVTSPTSTSEDPSPVVTATYGGTITAWRAITKNALGATVQDSGWTPGATVAFGTTKSVGAAGSAVVQVRDNVLRDATPGDPDYVQATQAFTVTPSGTPTAVASVTVTQDGVSPVVTVHATRASGVPDEVAVYRNGILVGRAAGADVFTGTTMSFRDTTAPMNVAAVYSVYAIVNGAWSNSASASSFTPSCIGLWILDTAGTEAAMILGTDDADQAQPEIAIVHRPISGPDGQAQVVRRRLSRYPREGAITGMLADALGVTAATSEAALRDWTDNDAGHIYRLVMGNQNDPVILGDIDLNETPENDTGQRVLDVDLNWWYQEP